MSNEYYTRNQNAIPGTTVRSKQFNGNNDDLTNGFNKLQDPDMLASGAARYAIDTGTVENQYVVTIDFKNQVVDYIAGMEITLKTSRSNTGACQISVNGLDPKLILSSDGFALACGQIAENSIVNLTYDGAAFRITSISYRDVKFDETEQVVLASMQTNVEFTTISTVTASFYIEGDLVDRGRLILGRDYTISSSSSIVLTNSYPNQTIVMGVVNEANSIDNITTPFIEVMTGRKVVIATIGAEFKKYTQYGNEITPILLFSSLLYEPLDDIGTQALIINGVVVDNLDYTITVPTTLGDVIFTNKKSQLI